MHSLLGWVFGLSIALCIQCAHAQGGFPQFTQAEQEWIKAHPIVQFSIHEKYRAYWDSGIYPKLLSKLKDCSGLEFSPRWRSSELVGIQQIRNGEVSLVIDPNRQMESAVSGRLTEPIFWGQDVMMATQPPITSSSNPKIEKTVFFDRGYDFSEPINQVHLVNSPELIVQQLLTGEAHFAVMPLRLAIHLSKQLNHQEIQIRPLGHQPFAYRWLIADQDRILRSIVQKSLHEADPFFMGELLAIPSLASNRSGYLANWLWFGILSSSVLIAFLVGHYIWQRKRQFRTESDLLSIAQEAKDASDAKSAFLATVSHEIRTPMNAVIVAQELLLKNSSLNQHQRELLQSAHTSAASLLGMLNQVLDMAKIEAGKFTVEHEPVDLKQILTEINQTFFGYAKNKGLHLASFIDPNIADVLLLDPLRIRQILHNLLSNAIKFTEQGLVFFEVRILANDHAGQLLEFRVIDQGIGMAKGDIERVQMPFEQIRSHLSSGSQSGSSTGLGLSITNHLIGLMQSKLLIESAPNLGTSIHFVVAFSRTCHSIEKSQRSPNSHGNPLFNNIRALIVEDHPASRQILFLQLQTLGIHVDQCANGDEALKYLHGNIYDMILTDHSMPGMHGTDLARTIRSKGYHDIVIIGITADIYAQTSQDKLIQSGMNGVLIKPIRLECLESELLKHFHQHHTRAPIKPSVTSFDMNFLILEEVYKVQLETLETLKKKVDLNSLMSLIHKIKGGALLSEDQLLFAQCVHLEKLDTELAVLQQSFQESLTASNHRLDKQINAPCSYKQIHPLI
jgi:two-component system, NarL family, sensor histidine kinase EvgS